MRKGLSAVLAILMLLSLAACGSQGMDMETYDPSSAIFSWMEKQIKNNTLFSFAFDGMAYAEHIKSWEKTIDKNADEWTVTYEKDNVIAWTEITFDREMASVEWTNYFKNTGSGDSPVISDIRAADTTLSVENPVLTTAEGSAPAATDFQSICVDLNDPEKNTYKMASNGGRSSQGAFPYFDICNGEYGVMGAIGWTGDWNANFCNENGEISFDAGMQATSISLHPDEQMRTPMILIQFFKGDQDDGHNSFRQLVLKTYTPSGKNGEPVDYGMFFIGVSNLAGQGEKTLMGTAQQLNRIKYECLWIDAGWYGDISGNTLSDGTWIQQVGNWYFIPDAYPNGNITQLGQYLQDNEKGLVLWFEPERVMPGTKLDKEHPEWLLYGTQDGGFRLLNLAMDEVCDYMIDWIGSTIKENRLTWYRQDFNCNPAERWRTADAAEGDNRIGITEIKYITNEYRFLDGLIEMNPGLLIDSCASGGKRLDLEMMRRSVPMWSTDYTCMEGKENTTPDGLRSINYNLTWWLPISSGGWPNYNAEDTDYNFRCSMMGGMQLNTSVATKSRIQDLIDEYYYCRELQDGDYYMLAYGKDDKMEYKDACYEFYESESGKGYLVAFRPENCTVESASYRLKGLEQDATYEITVTDNGEELLLTGEELMTDGLKINYPRSNLSILIYINKV